MTQSTPPDTDLDLDPEFQPHPSPLDVWALAQRDYLAGDPAPVVAERYGLSERTLHRRAAREGWRRSDAKKPLETMTEWRHRMLAQAEAARGEPVLDLIMEAHRNAQFDLLAAPDPTILRLFAFRRAAECAAMGHPGEAVVWMRLVQQVERSGDRIDRTMAAFPEADMIRAILLQGIGAMIPPDGADAAPASA